MGGYNLDLRYLFLSLSKDSGVFVCGIHLYIFASFICLDCLRSTRAIVKAHSMINRAA